MRAAAVLLLASAALFIAPAAPARSTEPPQPALTAVEGERLALVGEWRLNTALSDDPGAKMHEAREDGWGRGRGGGHGGGGGSDPTPAMLFTPSYITITNLLPEITMLEPDGGIRRLHADDKLYQKASGAEVRTRWEEGRLLVETKAERGRVRETWAATRQPRRLEVRLDVERPSGGAVVIKRVFDPVDPNAPRTGAPAEPPGPPSLP